MKIRDFLKSAILPERSLLYIIRDDAEILYVGKSFNIYDRICDHLGFSTRWSTGWFSETIRTKLPESLDWQIEFVQYPEEHLNPDFWANLREGELIKTLQPKYNVQFNPRYRANDQ